MLKVVKFFGGFFPFSKICARVLVLVLVSRRHGNDVARAICRDKTRITREISEIFDLSY